MEHYTIYSVGERYYPESANTWASVCYLGLAVEIARRRHEESGNHVYILNQDGVLQKDGYFIERKQPNDG